MHTVDITDSNIERIGKLFPNCLTERIGEDGKVEKVIDFDQLRQELSKEIVEGPQERYQFTWPDKKKAIRLANSPSNMTLRPCRKESVDFDNTENLYIEGDNLEVLKLLRENYLGRVKMIYIDPPYNTGNDFVYADDFSQTSKDYSGRSGQTDKEGNRLFQNNESNGRFHTDWLNMIYPRLKVAKDLLTNDGVILISIDDNEVDNLKKVCSEIFGDGNFIATLIWNKQHSQQQGIFKRYHESVLVYAKNADLQKNIVGGEGVIEAGAQKKISKANPASEFTFPAGVRFDAPDGTCLIGTYGDSEKTTVVEGRLLAKGGRTVESVTLSAGWTQKNQMRDFFNGKEVYDSKGQRVTEFFFNSAGKIKCTKDRSKITPPTLLPLYGMVSEQSGKLEKLMGGNYFDTPKPVDMIKDFESWFVHDNDIVLDFFSGSATTAQSTFELNAEDSLHRLFILVQLPEGIETNSAAYSAGFKTICDIGKERIRRAGKKVLEEQEKDESSGGLFAQTESKSKVDVGFRVLKLDSSNMNDVYYRPEEFSDQLIKEDNVKEDRTPEDLLFQVMLECNLPLSAKIQTEKIAGKEVFSVNNGYLIACFDEDVNEDVIKAVAKRKPYYFVMRDSSLSSDNVADNFEQIFQAYSKDTIRRIL